MIHRRFSHAKVAPISIELLLVLAAVYASAAPARAQAVAACPNGRISDVVIENHSVFDMEDPARSGRFEWAYRLANTLHLQTDREVIEREILFEVGDCYDVELLRDSERLLRGFSFLANADVYGIRMPNGEVQVIVDTQDEWSTRIQPRLGSSGTLGIRGIRLSEENLLGTGRHVGLFYEQEEDDGQRIYGAEYSTPHLFGTRLNMALQVARTEPGQIYQAEFTYPFVGETGRYAFRQMAGSTDRFFEILMPESDNDDLSRIWVPVRREHFEVGAAFRRSSDRFRHTILGAALAGERVEYPDQPRFAEQDGRLIPARSVLEPDWVPIASMRVMLLAGQRNIWFVRRRGIDTVNGIEDVQLGVEADASIGPALPGVSGDQDVAVSLGLFASGEPRPGNIFGGQFTFEARRVYETIDGFPEWTDVLGELDAWAYLRPHLNSPHSFVASISAVSGWHSRAPFQLTLGGDTGLRGYPRHVDPGGRRLVGSLEHRAYLGGPLSDLFDLGTVAFVDVGKIWPGKVPFGIESPIRGSVGVGIRAAFPPGSRQTLRVDVGLPIDRHAGMGNVIFSVGIGQAIGRRQRDPQLMRSARYSLESSDFVFPPARP